MTDPINFLGADPALQLLYAQLVAVDRLKPLPGLIPGTSQTYEDARKELRKQIIDEIAEYQQWKLRYFDKLNNADFLRLCA